MADTTLRQRFRWPRLALVVKLFAATMLIFICQKPLFMLYNRSADGSLTLHDYIAVALHGIKLDLTTTAYTLVVPALLVTASCLWRFKLRRWLAAYYLIVMATVAVIFVADTVMYSFWHFKLDATVFLYTDKPTDAMASVSTLFIIACAFAIAVCLVLQLIAIGACLPRRSPARPKNRLQAMWMLPLGALLFLFIRGGIDEGTANVSSVYFSERPFLNHSAVNATFNMLYSMLHKQDFSRECHYFDDAERARLVAGMFPTESVGQDTLLTTRRPDILLVVWEGCGASVAGCMGAGEDATPQLDSLARGGILFTNCKANSFRTDRGLVSINSGWLGLPTASLMKMPQKCETLPGLARSLRSAGYSTDFWYGGDITFTNMGGYMLQNGFQRTYSDADFPRSDRTTKWGVYDEVLLRRLLEDLRNRDSGTPWFTEVLTLSSHEPWKVPYKRLEKEIENSFAYTDSCLGAFVGELRRLPLWDNLLLIVVPDHGILSRPDLSLSSEDVVGIPLIFSGGAVREPQEIGVLMNQSDLAATLLGQLGIPHDDFVFSRDVLSEAYGAPSAIHTSRVEMTFHDISGRSVLDLTSGKTVSATGDGSDLRVMKGKAALQTLYEDAARR